MAKSGAKKPNQYTVLYKRLDSGQWTARIKELNGCHTMATSIDLAKTKIRKLLKQFDEDALFVEFIDEITLPVQLQAKVAALHKRKSNHEKEARIIQDDTLEAARILSANCGYSQRDIGAILGISHQRVQQLLTQSD